MSTIHYKYCTSEIPQQVHVQSNISLFWTNLKMKWDVLHSGNVFRYKINDIEEKIVGGRYLLQLNPERGFNRRQPESIKSICQPFDNNKFNFTKVSNDENIMNISNGNDGDIHSVLVNVSPISRYHSLICPSINKCLPQIVTLESLRLVLEIMFICQDRTLRIGFNSLCALASVNHLHYHILVESYKLQVECMKCEKLIEEVYCNAVDNDVRAFCFQIRNSTDITKTSHNVFKLIKYFLKENIAHNIICTHGEEFNGDGSEVIRIIVWPRKNIIGDKQVRAFNIAICELSGWFPIFDKQVFKDISEGELKSELQKCALDNFEDLCIKIKALFETYSIILFLK